MLNSLTHIKTLNDARQGRVFMFLCGFALHFYILDPLLTLNKALNDAGKLVNYCFIDWGGNVP